jgi:hypothetical protein
MQRVDRTLAALLIALGCVHNFVAAPMSYKELTVRALWFLSAGLAFWYAGFINLLRTRRPGQGDRFLAWLCVVTNLSMLAHTVTYAIVPGIWADPSAIALVAGVAVLTSTSLVHLVRLRSGELLANARGV